MKLIFSGLKIKKPCFVLWKFLFDDSQNIELYETKKEF